MRLTPKSGHDGPLDRATHQPERCTDAGKTGKVLVSNVLGSVKVMGTWNATHPYWEEGSSALLMP